MKEEVTIHKGFAEWETHLKDKDVRQMFGKYHYIFSSEKGKISCIELKNYLIDRDDFWEICCIKGDLFSDVERFDTFVDAKRRCQELLD
ncbi:MAG TPA: hypothetical protein VIR31_05875 [Nitrososphaeraceae archaeon]